MAFPSALPMTLPSAGSLSYAIPIYTPFAMTFGFEMARILVSNTIGYVIRFTINNIL